MNMPFPVVNPHLTFPDWFNADNPCDEDAELTKLEQAHHRWLNSITKRYVKHALVEKPDPEPVEEAETEDDGGNEDAEDSEDSHDEEEQIIPAVDPAAQNNIVEEVNIEDEFIPDVEVVEATLWPYTVQDD